MQVKELVDVLDRIDRFSRKHSLLNQYKKLITSLNQAKKKPSPELTAKFIQQREKIRSVHEAAEPVTWSSSASQIYQKLGGAELFGNHAMSRIDDIFQTHEGDPGSIAQAVQELTDRTTELIEHVQILLNGLSPLVQGEPAAYLDSTTLQILFPSDSSAPTIQKLEESLQKWDRVIAAFSRLARQEFEDSIIVNIEQRPLTIELAVYDDVLSAICRATCEVLSVYEKYLDIRRVGLEVNNLQLRNRGIADQLDKEAELLIRNTSNDVTKTLMEEFQWKKEGDKSEVHNHVSTAVATIFEFVRDDGKIDIFEDGKQPTLIKTQLADAFSQVNNLEQQIYQLSAINDSSIPADDSDFIS